MLKSFIFTLLSEKVRQVAKHLPSPNHDLKENAPKRQSMPMPYVSSRIGEGESDKLRTTASFLPDPRSSQKRPVLPSRDMMPEFQKEIRKDPPRFRCHRFQYLVEYRTGAAEVE